MFSYQQCVVKERLAAKKNTYHLSINTFINQNQRVQNFELNRRINKHFFIIGSV